MNKAEGKNRFPLFKKLKNTGFYHIFLSQIVNKIVTFSSSIFIVRFLSKGEFGLYTYANNIISMFLLFNGLGAVSGYLQFGSEYRNNIKMLKAYEKYSWKMGIYSSIFITAIIICFAVLYSFKIEGALYVVILMSLIPLVNFIFSHIEMGFRVRLQNKIYSSMTTIYNIFLFIATIFGAYFFQITGVVLFQYIAYLVCILIGCYIHNKYNSDAIQAELTRDRKIAFLKLSFISSINNGISQMLHILGVFVIGLLIPNEETIATYKTATTIPFAMNFIPLTIMMYVYPYFASNNQNIVWIKENYYKLLKYLGLLNLLISLFMFVFASQIILIFFGAEYYDAIAPFRILSIGYFITATFRIPSGNILLSLRRVKFNFFNALLSGVLNIFLNFLLIRRIGYIGAAYSTIIVYIISSLTSTAFLRILIVKNQSKLCE